ncbi:MAG: UDP-N-acetylglucosamine--LPS N-acetylglucosamine transferase [Sedimentitalea sp.]
MTQNVRVMATASAGGHWVQLMRLRPAWSGCDVTYVTTDPGLETPLRTESRKTDDHIAGFYTVTEANRWNKLRLVRQLFQLLRIIYRTRPDVVITTGAAPGYFALRLGRLFGARTVWIDSIANAEELSLSGKQARAHADLWLTQWGHLSDPNGPKHLGSVI